MVKGYFWSGWAPWPGVSKKQQVLASRAWFPGPDVYKQGVKAELPAPQVPSFGQRLRGLGTAQGKTWGWNFPCQCGAEATHPCPVPQGMLCTLPTMGHGLVCLHLGDSLAPGSPHPVHAACLVSVSK